VLYTVGINSVQDDDILFKGEKSLREINKKDSKIKSFNWKIICINQNDLRSELSSISKYF